jgi:hypothetical protein
MPCKQTYRNGMEGAYIVLLLNLFLHNNFILVTEDTNFP